MNCSCCFDTIINDCITCDSCKNSTCSECLVSYLINITPDMIKTKINKDMNGIICLNPECEFTLDLYEISRSLSKDSFNVFHKIWNNLFRYKVEIDTLQINKEQKDETMSIVNEWSELLTPKCPSCNQGFNEFDGCFSIKCSRCKHHFCGWCLDYHGESRSVHIHATYCRKKEGININDDYYGSKNEFDICLSRNVMTKINHILIKNNDKKYSEALYKMKKQFEMHGLYIDDTTCLLYQKDFIYKQHDRTFDVLLEERIINTRLFEEFHGITEQERIRRHNERQRQIQEDEERQRQIEEEERLQRQREAERRLEEYEEEDRVQGLIDEENRRHTDVELIHLRQEIEHIDRQHRLYHLYHAYFKMICKNKYIVQFRAYEKNLLPYRLSEKGIITALYEKSNEELTEYIERISNFCREIMPKSKIIQCGNCKYHGHNKRTCFNK